MQKLRFSDLAEVIRKFLAGAEDGMIIENDAGQPQYSISPYRYPTPEQRQQAEESLAEIQKHTAAAMKEAGVTEDDIDRVLQEDD